MDSMSHPDDSNTGGETVRPIQPYESHKRYVCPGCDSWIEIGIGHLVVVPDHERDLRRHWHRGCWFKEQRRRGSTGSR